MDRVLRMGSLALAIVACGGEEGPPETPQAPLLVYTEGLPESQRVVAVRADGTGRRVLIEPGAGERYVIDAIPYPDAAHVLVGFTDRSFSVGNWYRVPLDGGTSEPVATPDRAMPLRWSPDGRALLWLWSGRRLGMAMPGSTNISWASPEELWVAQSAWASDARRVTFSANTLGVSELTIYVTDQFGVADPVSDGSGIDRAPAWSPVEETIAFVREAVGVYLVTPGTPARLLAAGSYGPYVYWSPDGRWLVGERSNGTGGLDLVRIDPRTGQYQTLMAGYGQKLTAHTPWSPDGTLIVLSGDSPDPERSVMVVGSDGSGVVPLIPAGSWGTMPRWVPALPQ